MIIVVMGVSGIGKTTIGSRLADRLGWHYAEGDDYHPPANVKKMAAGHPLSDDDRWPWLETLAAEMRNWDSQNKDAVVACSALNKSYRVLLAADAEDLLFAYMRADRAVLARRVGSRDHPYMPASLLDSQLATLEDPTGEPNVLSVDADADPDAIVARIIAELAKRKT